MKRRLVVILLLLIAHGLFAEEKMKPYLSVGMSVPVSPVKFRDYWRAGFNLGGRVQYQITSDLIAEGCLNYSRFALNDEKFLEDFEHLGVGGLEIKGGAAAILTLFYSFKALLAESGPAIPYVTAGFGFFRLSTDDITINYEGASMKIAGDSDEAFLIFAGPGVRTRNFFIEGRYAAGLTEKITEYFLIELGVLLK